VPARTDQPYCVCSTKNIVVFRLFFIRSQAIGRGRVQCSPHQQPPAPHRSVTDSMKRRSTCPRQSVGADADTAGTSPSDDSSAEPRNGSIRPRRLPPMARHEITAQPHAPRASERNEIRELPHPHSPRAFHPRIREFPGRSREAHRQDARHSCINRIPAVRRDHPDSRHFNRCHDSIMWVRSVRSDRLIAGPPSSISLGRTGSIAPLLLLQVEDQFYPAFRQLFVDDALALIAQSFGDDFQCFFDSGLSWTRSALSHSLSSALPETAPVTL
jgi:hypothetical protein